MNAYLKIAAGALMVVLGAYSSITFWNELLVLLKAGVGPLLLMVGAFVVWLESDELKFERKQKKENKKKKKGLQKEFKPSSETSGFKHREILEGNVDEVKQSVRNMDDLTSSDLRTLLEQEKQGKDRKTVKEFLKKRID
jgi:hypothetical protein